MAQKHVWKNSQGKEFALNIVPPFFEDAIIENVANNIPEPPLPHFSVDITLPNGKTQTEYYPYSEEALTEEVFTDSATNIVEGLLSPNGNKVRWQDWVTANDKRTWLGYKSKLVKYIALREKSLGEKIFKGLLCAGINVEITDEWRADFVNRYGYKPENEKYSYLLDQVCVTDSDFGDLAIAINEIRQVSREKIDTLVGNFRKAKERDTVSESA